MAKILCDCGCGKTVEKVICVNNAHRMKYVRNLHIYVRKTHISEATTLPSLSRAKDLEDLRVIMEDAKNSAKPLPKLAKFAYEEREDAEGNVMCKNTITGGWYLKDPSL